MSRTTAEMPRAWAKWYLIWYLSIQVSIFTEANRIRYYAGPYTVVMHREISNKSKEFVSNGDIWTRLNVSHYKTGQLQYVWGRTYNRIPFSDNIKVRAYISQWSNHQWKRNAYVLRFDRACSDLRVHSKTFADLLFGEDSNRCPIPPGDRIVRNQTVDVRYPQFPVFPYGRWLFHLVGYLRSRPVLLYVVEADTIPKLD